jgi:hypothetical protein
MVYLQEVDREDPGCLGVQELPPGRARAAGRWVDACRMQDLPHCGSHNGEAEGSVALADRCARQSTLVRIIG